MLAFLVGACVLLNLRDFFYKKESSDISKNVAFLAFRNSYVLVYCFMMAGDWLQGPYVFSLYQHYGFSVNQIGLLFIAGFGSSLVFGTFVGSLADRIGRKKACLLYCVIYVASCLTKHWADFRVLLLGRVFGGIATSLLFSAFESWLVAEHFKKGFDESLLGSTFSRAVFYGNGLVAILAGVLANFLVDSLDLGPVAPFDAAIVFLSVGGVIILLTWAENKGSGDQRAGVVAQFLEAGRVILNDRNVFLLGCMQALFEGAMYSFVFLWTPSLSVEGEELQHGLVFSNFMLSCMIGSNIAGMLMDQGYNPESYMRLVFALGSACMFVVFYSHYSAPDKNVVLQAAGDIRLMAFCFFEIIVGIFWPSMMKMRSAHIPDKVRSTVINIFRMPLNIFVCAILLNVDDGNIMFMFLMCSAFLASACACQVSMHSKAEK